MDGRKLEHRTREVTGREQREKTERRRSRKHGKRLRKGTRRRRVTSRLRRGELTPATPGIHNISPSPPARWVFREGRGGKEGEKCRREEKGPTRRRGTLLFPRILVATIHILQTSIRIKKKFLLSLSPVQP